MIVKERGLKSFIYFVNRFSNLHLEPNLHITILNMRWLELRRFCYQPKMKLVNQNALHKPSCFNFKIT